MVYATWLPDILTDAGLTVHAYPGWQIRGKPDFDPRGVIIHHTVTRPTASDAVVDRILALRGSSTVPPPLANYSTNRDGTVSVIAAGTANHGGAGSWKGVSGNRFWLGDEMKNLGTSAEPWPGVQVDAAMRAAAACLEHIGADESWMAGHKEYAPSRKVDPHSLNMTTLRATVKTIMEDDMPTLEEIEALIDAKTEGIAEATRKEIMGTILSDGDYSRSFLLAVSRTELKVRSVLETVGGIDLEGVSEAELDARVAELAVLISAQPAEFIAKLKAAL